MIQCADAGCSSGNNDDGDGTSEDGGDDADGGDDGLVTMLDLTVTVMLVMMILVMMFSLCNYKLSPCKKLVIPRCF